MSFIKMFYVSIMKKLSFYLSHVRFILLMEN